VEIFGRGGDACRPRFAVEGLSQSLIDPAVGALRRRDADIRFNTRLRGLDTDGAQLTQLHFGSESIDVAPGDAVILAVPAPVAAGLLPSIRTPARFNPIVNVHFRLTGGAQGRDLPPILGIVGGVAEWVFCRGPIVSITISAADRHLDDDPDGVAEAAWRDVSRTLGLPAETPPFRVIKEKRATFAQTPAEEPNRPPTRTNLRNLFLSGDWTDTGLPATIEGAARSGFSAADMANRLLENR
jgi:predicted NAD/FAD-dependent oxidoreductase